MLRFAIALLISLVPALAHAQVKVVIDPGHGGTDPGGVGSGMQEKNVVLDVSTRFKKLLDADTADEGGGGKWTALMTRTGDTFPSLAARSQYSNNQGADRFMSIHANAFGDPSANGIETFSLAATGNGANLRNLVQAEMVSAWGLTNRGNKTANFAVLRDTAAPAVLHELAFITNATDAQKLGSPTEREKAAVAHLRALQRHYNQTPYLPNSTPEPPVTESGDIAGIVVGDGGPLVGAKVELAGGASVLTDGNGAFVLEDAPAGAAMLTASAEGYATKTVELTVVAAAREEITIELARQREGEIPDEVSGETIGGCTTTTSHGSLLVVMFGLVVVLRRRRA